MAKVYSLLGSGVVASLIFGYFASKGFIHPVLIGLVSIVAIIAEISLLFLSPENKTGKNYLKPGTFYSYAFIVGSTVGNLFIGLPREDKLLLAEIVTSSFIYSVLIFASFSFFALTTVRRTVNKYFYSIASFLWICCYFTGVGTNQHIHIQSNS